MTPLSNFIIMCSKSRDTEKIQCYSCMFLWQNHWGKRCLQFYAYSIYHMMNVCFISINSNIVTAGKLWTYYFKHKHSMGLGFVSKRYTWIKCQWECSFYQLNNNSFHHHDGCLCIATWRESHRKRVPSYYQQNSLVYIENWALPFGVAGTILFPYF